jgi:CRISPR-associated endoribonuclease Cas6
LKYYELKISTQLKAPIHFQKSPEAISKLIATALINSGYKEHSSKKIKNYVFSNLGRANKNGLYEKEGSFYFRSFDKNLAMMAAKSLMFYEDNIFKIKSIENKSINFEPIEVLYSQSPVFVVTKSKDFWTINRSGDIGELLELLQNNLVKKYKDITGEELKPSHNFIQALQIKNEKPFTLMYKGVKFFGNKFYLEIREDEISQKLAFTALGAGLGVKNSSVGGGFCIKLKKK